MTDANKAHVIVRLVQHELIDCRIDELRALRHGFHTVHWRSHIALFEGGELRELMCGVPRLDAASLWQAIHLDERCGEALGGWLRELVFTRAEPWRKSLLRFVTGFYVLPRNGLARRIHVRPQPEASAHQLPTASTCFYELLLPVYPSRDELAAKLDAALDNSAGFFLS